MKIAYVSKSHAMHDTMMINPCIRTATPHMIGRFTYDRFATKLLTTLLQIANIPEEMHRYEFKMFWFYGHVFISS